MESVHADHLDDAFNVASDFWIDISKISILEEIGRGMFSAVHLGRYFGDPVAVKIQRREDRALEKYVLRELSILKNARHEGLVQYIGAYNEERPASNDYKLYIVTELCANGDLLGLVLDTSQALGWRIRIKFLLQAASALAYLHEHHLIHRDIKSSNLLLDAQWNCKISDFGMCREYAEQGPRMTICGTDEYMAPELLFDEEYNSAVDLFSLGMVILEIVRRSRVGQDGFAERHPRDK